MFDKIRRFFLKAEKEAFHERQNKRRMEARSRRKGSISLKPLRRLKLGDDIQVKIISAYQWKVNDAIEIYPATKRYTILESKETGYYKNLEEFFNSLSEKGEK